MWKRIVILAACACLSAAPRGRAQGGEVPATAPTGAVRSVPADAQPRPEVVSLLGVPLFAEPVGGEREKLHADLAAALADFVKHPDDPEKTVWVGRRLGYLWRMHEAIEVYSKGIEKFPDYAPLYRHRGHRYISIRQFDRAVADLEKAAALMEGRPDEVEPDGMPNALNIPLTTTAFNVWYHLGLARYLQGDFDRALQAYGRTMEHARRYDDNLVATTHWMYMTLRRLGRADEAAALLEPIRPDMRIVENTAYHKLTLVYKGLLKPAEVLAPKDTNALDTATLGYGVGNWFQCNGEAEQAAEAFERVVAGTSWPAFGFIAAEVELARLRRLQ